MVYLMLDLHSLNKTPWLLAILHTLHIMYKHGFCNTKESLVSLDVGCTCHVVLAG